MLDKKVLVKLEIRWDKYVFEMPAGFYDYPEEDAECCAILEVSKLDEVVDDHEGTNGEGNVGVKSEGQVVYERKFQRIQKNKEQILSNGSDERQNCSDCH